MSPFEGDAFLHSQIKETPGFLSAFSKAKEPLGRDKMCIRDRKIVEHLFAVKAGVHAVSGILQPFFNELV